MQQDNESYVSLVRAMPQQVGSQCRLFIALPAAPGRWECRRRGDSTRPPGLLRKTDFPSSGLLWPLSARCCSSARRFPIRDPESRSIASLRVEESHQEIADRADVLDIEDEPVRRSLRNVHSVDGLARKVVGLLKVEYLAFLHLIRRKVFAALTWLQAGQSMGGHN